MKRLISMSFGLIIVATPAAAIETCRFIEAKAEREACYHRQEQELAAKRKPEPTATRSSESKTFDQLQQMRRDDEEVYRSMRGICRGC
ncbi:hypothetical protein QA635_40170 [Bradyrhizobium brasilense]|uniref:hypothetical protein n=1 Tax=Bradyrhizobium brasilense TaxID=1419277 RepID=UPI0024B18554|nr:hypothetical protein [Bradyrhizobium australafricanum]WFU32623.1 hypothetical protein QA635_40170 [Bradyrhizobium australafricanum]